MKGKQWTKCKIDGAVALKLDGRLDWSSVLVQFETTRRKQNQNLKSKQSKEGFFREEGVFPDE
jgi:hypothetical protein